uniref:Uncharacterized protein n=1 Tax=Brassica oleracea var. oleracea TaxID=109376 RepID=A0A0D3DI03_BRAOL
MNTIKSLSSSNEICLEMVSLGFVKNLTSLLQKSVFSKQSIIILRNLCNTEKGRICITETPGCLASIAELLDSDVPEEQENAISILLQLCVEKIEYCNLVVREGVDMYSSLFLISNNGTEEAKVSASELLRALEEVDSHREEESSTLEGATTSQTVITPVKHQEPMLTTPSLKKSASIAELLDSDVPEEQENAISILLLLCVEKIEYCKLVVREGVDIYSSLFLISNNGTEEAKVGASEFLRALEEVDSNSSPEGATTSQVVITPVKHQEPMLTTPSLKKSGLFGLRFPFSSTKKTFVRVF